MAFSAASALMDSALPPDEWEVEFQQQDDDEDEEPFTPIGNEDPIHIFDQWKNDSTDQQHGMFHTEDEKWSNSSFTSPSGPIEELNCVMDLNGLPGDDRFFVPILSSAGTDDEMDTSSSPLSFEERFEESIKNLVESMKRSKETRKSLTVETPETYKYMRKQSVDLAKRTVEEFTHQLQNYLAREV